jgi:hypothetical protein
MKKLHPLLVFEQVQKASLLGLFFHFTTKRKSHFALLHWRLGRDFLIGSLTEFFI